MDIFEKDRRRHPARGHTVHATGSTRDDPMTSQSRRNIRVPKRSVIYTYGQADRKIFSIVRGRVKTVTVSPGGKECLLGLYGPGDIFGELSLVQRCRTESAVAMSESILSPVDTFAGSNVELPEDLAGHLLGVCLRRMADQQAVITDLVTRQSEHRLAATLLRLARKFGTQEGNLLRLEAGLANQQELSTMVGTTRSRVGYFLRRFNENGLTYRVPGALLLHEDRIEDFLLSDYEM